ncbi:MAG: hypothetical protein OEZ01_09235 [Candidatus Heimdallarchaeota archaeon]|nr:hypothetical protein [Candidatus Heimdallarchaeota archaeon]MDH5646178.1 hypothetical protein [Candidatus Heimdallarchaeota archaeon]
MKENLNSRTKQLKINFFNKSAKLKSKLTVVSGKKIKSDSFKFSNSKTKSTQAGGVILSVGLIFGFGVPLLMNLLFSEFYIFLFLSSSNHTLFGILNLFTQILPMIALNITDALVWFTIGWFIGGILSGLLYGKTASRGSLYSSGLLITILSSILYIVGVSLITNQSTLFNDAFGLNLANGWLISTISLLIIILIIITLFSLPLILISFIGFRVGLILQKALGD